MKGGGTMKLESLYDMLTETGIPVIYGEWNDNGNGDGTGDGVPPLPYICYYVDGTDNFTADNRVYAVLARIVVDLYTEVKAPDTEQTVESILGQFGVTWDRDEAFVRKENMYLTRYTIMTLLD